MTERINKIEFPVLDISIKEWNIENISEIIFYDIYFHNNSYELFEKLRLNHKVVDSKGIFFRIINIQSEKRNWKTFFFKSKQKMIFELSDDSISIQDLKDFVLNKINNLEGNEYKFKWIENIKKAKNFKELITSK